MFSIFNRIVTVTVNNWLVTVIISLYAAMTNVAKSFQLDVLASDKGRNRNLRRKDKSTNQYNNLQTLHRDGERQRYFATIPAD